MNKVFFVIIVLVSINKQVLSQFSAQQINDAIDYLNYNSVELSIKQSDISNGINLFNSKCDKNSKYEEILNAIPKTLSKTITICNEINTLKNDKDSLLKSNILQYLTVIAFNNPKYPALSEFKKNREKDGSWGSFIQDFQNYLKSVLQLNDSNQKNFANKPDASSESNTKEDIKTKPNEIIIKEESWYDGFKIEFDLISLFVSVALFIYFLVSIKKMYRRINKLKSTLLNSGGITKADNFIIKNLQQEINKINISNSKLSLDYEKLKNIYDKKELLVEKELDNVSSQSDKIFIDKPEVFYLSSPNIDGSFNQSSTHSVFKPGASIYRFTKIDIYRAEFQIDDNEDAMKLALHFSDKNIDPVCDTVNAFNPKSKKILTTQVGYANLENNKWIVTKKAIIQYE